MHRFQNTLARFALRNRQLLMLAAFALFICVVGPSAAHAQSVANISAIISFWTSTVKPGLLLVCAAACVVCLAMAIFKFIGRDIGEAIIWCLGSALCGWIVANSVNWVGSGTGVSL